MNGTDPVDVLVRRQEHGGVRHVLERSPSRVTVSPRRCAGGEEVERPVSEGPALPASVAERSRPADYRAARR
ncbi:hypothetical protein PWG71_15055 [Nocardiopsis sp. N85]|uniref:hypothetical protein n=1 Tax=Nocardiopsis sp. N85 TaxID=3029400 RepID=UPI00237FBDD7|nr:hypothetical protein [Nocardiopsis sp. N85]MDE3722706.1 hypothetical protein [Nocardiopsis sp. N85]